MFQALTISNCRRSFKNVPKIQFISFSTKKVKKQRKEVQSQFLCTKLIKSLTNSKYWITNWHRARMSELLSTPLPKQSIQMPRFQLLVLAWSHLWMLLVFWERKSSSWSPCSKMKQRWVKIQLLADDSTKFAIRYQSWSNKRLQTSSILMSRLLTCFRLLLKVSKRSKLS